MCDVAQRASLREPADVDRSALRGQQGGSPSKVKPGDGQRHGRPARGVTPAIKLQGNCTFSGNGITIKQLNKTWQQ
jgi:hypothetical protein